MVVFDKTSITLPSTIREGSYQDFDRSKAEIIGEDRWMEDLIKAIKSRVYHSKKYIKSWMVYCPACNREYSKNIPYCLKCLGPVIPGDSYSNEKIQLLEEEKQSLKGQKQFLEEHNKSLEEELSKLRKENELLKNTKSEEKPLLPIENSDIEHASTVINEIIKENIQRIPEDLINDKRVQWEKEILQERKTKKKTLGSKKTEICLNFKNKIITQGITTLTVAGLLKKLLDKSIECINCSGDTILEGCSSLKLQEYDNGYYLGNEEKPYIILLRAKSTDITSCEINGNTKMIYSAAFKNCSKLTSITISKNIVRIGDEAFNHNSISNVYYDGTIEDWCKGPFTGKKLYTSFKLNHFYLKNSNNEWEEVTSIEIPNTITEIGYAKFCNFNNVTSTLIPNSITNIGSDAFENCYRLVEIYNLSSLNITKGCDYNYGGIGYYAKVIHKSLEEKSNLFINDDFLFIKDKDNKYYLVRYNGTVTDLVLLSQINRSTYELNSYAFINDDGNLKSIEIPGSITSIEANAFCGCDNLTNVYYKGTIEKWCNIAFKNIYSNPMIWASHFYLRNSNNEWEEVTSIEIPNTITKIGAYQFKGFNNVTSITIPNSVTSIGYGAFWGCRSLTSIFISDRVVSIGDCCFFRCISLTRIVIPNSVTSIGGHVFEDCNSLASIVISNNITSIEASTFDGCSGLTSIILPDSITSIGKCAFWGCRSLTSIVTSKSVSSIEEDAFKWCNNIEYAALPAFAIPFIPKDNLKGLVITSGIKIEEKSFLKCKNLKCVVIPNSITVIDPHTFKDCNSLKEVYYNGTSKEWNNIMIEDSDLNLTSTEIYYYSEKKPIISGKYWHYVDGVPTKWDIILAKKFKWWLHSK